ncbi:MAG: glycosyltransferase [Verrucomicrobiota bacterium]|nr:glycosyltransferase [Verrucomicrobiota bacterium]
MKICDLTQFHSPMSGGVKRYVSEKVRYLRACTEGDDHVLIIPGDRDAVIREERSRTYLIKSPLVSGRSRYRILLRLAAIEEILEREKPDLIESGDPYQVAWKAVHSGAALGIPVVGFYHSHFPEAYVRTVQKFLGRTMTEYFIDFSRRYIRNLYNRFERTLVPSPALGAVLTGWGVTNVALTDLGVDTEVFQPRPEPGEDARGELGIPRDRTLLLYVGRLAQEKNTATLFAAYRLLDATQPARFHLLVVGDGLQRRELGQLQGANGSITWLPYCSEATRLARLYRAADLFVHPGVQETFGLVSLEAQACGTPVIGIRGSYMDRIIHSDQTIWAGENSAPALAAAIAAHSAREFLTDPHLLHELVAAQYSWNQVFTGLFAIYREVVAGRVRAK